MGVHWKDKDDGIAEQRGTEAGVRHSSDQLWQVVEVFILYLQGLIENQSRMYVPMSKSKFMCMHINIYYNFSGNIETLLVKMNYRISDV